jgi:serine/threonine-protein kinase
LPLSTAAYTAPERAEGRGADQRTDLYAVGVLLFQLVSGRLPVRGATSDELLRAHREHATLRLQDIGRRVHPELEELIARLLAWDPAQRPDSAGEAALMMRSLAALAAAVPVEDELAEDDPIAILPARTSGAPPPQMLPPAVDPGLERAMMGHVPSAPPERIPGVPEWAVFVPPRWWPAAAAVVLAGALAVVLVRSAHERAAPGAAAAVRTAAVPAAPQAFEPTPPPTAADALRTAPGAEPPRPSKLAQNAASPWAKNFDRAQKALWTSRPGGALTILKDILRKPGLSRRDQARASRMMGEAEAKKGNRAKAVQWWRRSFQLYDDPEERAKVARLLQAAK